MLRTADSSRHDVEISAKYLLLKHYRGAPAAINDVDSHERAVELAGELASAPGADRKPIHEWLELRPFLHAPPTVTS